MRAFQGIPRGRDFWSSWLVIVALAVAAGFLTASAARIVIRERSIRGEKSALEEEIRMLEAEKQRLEESLRASASPEAIERLVKETLNLKKPGEEVVVVVPDRSSAAGTPARSGLRARFGTWLDALLEILRR